MDRKGISSTNIVSVGYDDASAILEVEFKDGHIYQYFGVPAQVHMDLMSAGSHGSFMNSHVRGQYRYQRIA